MLHSYGMADRHIQPGIAISTAFAGFTQDAVARHLGITRQTVNRLYQGRQAITPDMALRLEVATGQSAEDWMMIQMKYELEKRRHELADNRNLSAQRVVSAQKQISRLKDLKDLQAGVSADVVQARNSAFDGSRYRIKRRAFKG